MQRRRAADGALVEGGRQVKVGLIVETAALGAVGRRPGGGRRRGGIAAGVQFGIPGASPLFSKGQFDIDAGRPADEGFAQSRQRLGGAAEPTPAGDGLQQDSEQEDRPAPASRATWSGPCHGRSAFSVARRLAGWPRLPERRCRTKRETPEVLVAAAEVERIGDGAGVEGTFGEKGGEGGGVGGENRSAGDEEVGEEAGAGGFGAEPLGVEPVEFEGVALAVIEEEEMGGEPHVGVFRFDEVEDEALGEAGEAPGEAERDFIGFTRDPDDVVGLFDSGRGADEGGGFEAGGGGDPFAGEGGVGGEVAAGGEGVDGEKVQAGGERQQEGEREEETEGRHSRSVRRGAAEVNGAGGFRDGFPEVKDRRAPGRRLCQAMRMTRREAMAVSAAAGGYGLQLEAAPRGRFFREWWYEPGLANGNPGENRRFRVNAPEAVLHPTFHSRPEVRSSGMLQIRVDETPRLLAGAELYLELWGGHPGTANKRVTPNGRATYRIPEVGAEAGHCTHQYPLIRMKPSDLAPGFNAFQFAADQGSAFWGHFIVDEACVRCELPAAHGDLERAGLSGFSAAVEQEPIAGGEGFQLTLRTAEPLAGAISGVEFQGYYEGYDENGSTLARDWHGFTTFRRPVAYLGAAVERPFRVRWDTSMLPAQREMKARAFVRFREHANLVYETAALEGLATGVRGGRGVRFFGLAERPAAFWSRAGRAMRATIELDADPGRVERAELHVVVWDGGRGGMKDYFTLNGHPLEVARDGRHDTIYTVAPVAPALLRRGINEIVLLSDSTHHGIEVLEPGPALAVRGRWQDGARDQG